MAYKCKNCGKFVAKDAIVCKHCGQKNPAELVNNNTIRNSYNMNSSNSVVERTLIQCPNCGSQLTWFDRFENNDYLHCSICNQKFENPLKSIKLRSIERRRRENFLKEYGCLIIVGIIVLISIICYSGSDEPSLPLYEDKYAIQTTAKSLIKKTLRDPDSFQLIEIVPETGKVITVRYRSKNGFGGYNVCTAVVSCDEKSMHLISNEENY